MIRTLIVDDEPLARRAVRAQLAGHGDWQVVGEAEHGKEAVRQIRQHRPDMVFLDVQMPEMSGFDVIEAVGLAEMPLIVFVTAFYRHAVAAFEVHALDYVLKPFDDERFNRVLNRARDRIAQGDGQARRLDGLIAQLAPVPKLVARGNGTARLVQLTDIDWIGAAGDYAEVHAAGCAVLLNQSLASLDATLPKQAFSRIHRSAIVRLDRIAEVRSASHGDGIVRLRCGAELRLSRRYRHTIDVYLAEQAATVPLGEPAIPPGGPALAPPTWRGRASALDRRVQWLSRSG